MTGIDPTTCKPGPYRVIFEGLERDAFRLSHKSQPDWLIQKEHDLHLQTGHYDITVLHRLVPEPKETADGEALAQLVRDVRDGQAHSATIDGVLIAPCDDRGLVDACHAQEQRGWEVLREAAVIMSDIAGVNPSMTEDHLRRTARRLEAEHRAAQEKAEQDAAREALIEKALDAFVARYKDSGLRMDRPNRLSPVYIAFEAAADAGLLAEAVQS